MPTTPQVTHTPIHTHAISPFHVEGCGRRNLSSCILSPSHPATLYQPYGHGHETSYLMEDKKSKHMEGACPESIKRLFIIIWELKSHIKNKRRYYVAFAALQPQRRFIVIQSLRISCWVARAGLCRRDKIPHSWSTMELFNVTHSFNNIVLGCLGCKYPTLHFVSNQREVF